jgi:hypothetical protein
MARSVEPLRSPGHPLLRIHLLQDVHLPLHSVGLYGLCYPQFRLVFSAFDISRRSRFQPSAAAGRVVIGSNLFGAQEAGGQWKRDICYQGATLIFGDVPADVEKGGAALLALSL